MEKTKKQNGFFQREFEIAQLLKEMNPEFRRGVTPIASPTTPKTTAATPPTGWPQPTTPTNGTPWVNGSTPWTTPVNNQPTWGMVPTNTPWGMVPTTTPWNTMPTNTPWNTIPWMQPINYGTPVMYPTPNTPTNVWPGTPYANSFVNTPTPNSWPTTAPTMHNGSGNTETGTTLTRPQVWQNTAPVNPYTNGTGIVNGTSTESTKNGYGVPTTPTGYTSEVMPPCNVCEFENRFCVEMMVPGFTEKDCTIRVSNGILWVHGTRKETNTNKETNFFTTQEFGNFSFKRSFIVTEEVASDKISACCVDGILTLTLPKKVQVPQKEKRVSELV